MQRETQHVDRRLQQLRRRRGEQRRDRGIVRDEMPMPVDRDRRIGLMTFSTRSTALRAACSAGSSSDRCENTGA